MSLRIQVWAYRRAFATICAAIALSGCAQNIVSLNEWWSRTTLIDPDGLIYEGKATFHWAYRDGTIEISNSRTGSLSGRFSTQNAVRPATAAIAIVGGDNISVPTAAAISGSMGSNEGTAYLARDGVVVLRCRIGVDFRTQGMGDAQMVGGGACADSSGKIYQLFFGR
jgi:hypothetical protein